MGRDALAPTLSPGDSLPVHKSAKAARVPSDHGAWLLYPPSQSPNLNPVELALSKLEARRRAAGARAFDALWRAIGSVCHLFRPQRRWNDFGATGHAPD